MLLACSSNEDAEGGASCPSIPCCTFSFVQWTCSDAMALNTGPNQIRHGLSLGGVVWRTQRRRAGAQCATKGLDFVNIRS
jgi:hypothetical protein